MDGKSVFLRAVALVVLLWALLGACAPKPIRKMNQYLNMTISFATPLGEQLTVETVDEDKAEQLIAGLAGQLANPPNLYYTFPHVYLLADGRVLQVTNLDKRSGIVFQSMDDFAKCFNIQRYLRFSLEFYKGRHFVWFLLRDDLIDKVLGEQKHGLDSSFDTNDRRFIGFEDGSCMQQLLPKGGLAFWFPAKEQFLVFWQREKEEYP
jgi:hypothetical protein